MASKNTPLFKRKANRVQAVVSKVNGINPPLTQATKRKSGSVTSLRGSVSGFELFEVCKYLLCLIYGKIESECRFCRDFLRWRDAA